MARDIADVSAWGRTRGTGYRRHEALSPLPERAWPSEGTGYSRQPGHPGRAQTSETRDIADTYDPPVAVSVSTGTGYRRQFARIPSLSGAKGTGYRRQSACIYALSGATGTGYRRQLACQARTLASSTGTGHRRHSRGAARFFHYWHGISPTDAVSGSSPCRREPVNRDQTPAPRRPRDIADGWANGPVGAAAVFSTMASHSVFRRHDLEQVSRCPVRRTKIIDLNMQDVIEPNGGSLHGA